MDSNTEFNSTSTYETSSNQPEGWEDHRFITPSDFKTMIIQEHGDKPGDQMAISKIIDEYKLLYPILCKSFELQFNGIFDLVTNYLIQYGVDVRNPPQIMKDLIEMRKLKEKEKAEKQKLKENDEDDLTKYFYDPKSTDFLDQLESPNMFISSADKKDMIKQYTKDYKKLFSKKQTPLWVLSAGVEMYNDMNVNIMSDEGNHKLDDLIQDSLDDTEMDHSS